MVEAVGGKFHVIDGSPVPNEAHPDGPIHQAIYEAWSKPVASAPASGTAARESAPVTLARIERLKPSAVTRGPDGTVLTERYDNPDGSYELKTPSGSSATVYPGGSIRIVNSTPNGGTIETTINEHTGDLVTRETLPEVGTIVTTENGEGISKKAYAESHHFTGLSSTQESNYIGELYTDKKTGITEKRLPNGVDMMQEYFRKYTPRDDSNWSVPRRDQQSI